MDEFLEGRIDEVLADAKEDMSGKHSSREALD